jgi:hypothetical protein
MKFVLYKAAKKYEIEHPYLVFFPFGYLYVFEMLAEIHSMTDEFGGRLLFYNRIIPLIPLIGIPLFGILPLCTLLVRMFRIHYDYVLPILLPRFGKFQVLVLALVPFVKYIFIWREL